MPWSRWVEHDGWEPPATLVGRLIRRQQRNGLLVDRALWAVAKFSRQPTCCKCSGAFPDNWIWAHRLPCCIDVLRYRVWSDELPSFDVTRIDADRPMELAEWE